MAIARRTQQLKSIAVDHEGTWTTNDEIDELIDKFVAAPEPRSNESGSKTVDIGERDPRPTIVGQLSVHDLGWNLDVARHPNTREVNDAGARAVRGTARQPCGPGHAAAPGDRTYSGVPLVRCCATSWYPCHHVVVFDDGEKSRIDLVGPVDRKTDVSHGHFAGELSARMQQQPRLRGPERDGHRSTRWASPHFSGQGVDTARYVDCENLCSGCGCDVLAPEPRAVRGVDHQVTIGEVHRRTLGIEHHHARTTVLEATCRNPTIGSVVPLPRQHDDAPAVRAVHEQSCRVGNGIARALDESFERGATVGIDVPHLFGRENESHVSSVRVKARRRPRSQPNRCG
jgi:hypothetical protein